MVLEDNCSLSNSGFRYVAGPPYCRCLSDLKHCDFFKFLLITVDRLQANVVKILTPTSSFLGMMEKPEFT